MNKTLTGTVALVTGASSGIGAALTTPADVTDAEQVAAAVAATVGELGRLDTRVNNAGLLRTGDAA